MLGLFLLTGVLFSIAFYAAAHYAWRVPRQAAEDQLAARMRELRVRAAGASRTRQGADLIRRENRGTFAFFADFLEWFKPLKRLQAMIHQADLKYRATDVMMISLIIFIVAFGLAGLFGASLLVIRFAIALLLASIPTFYIVRKRASRLHKFELQLPDTIDLFNRSMKAGHNIHSGLETIASESSDPVQKEFRKVMEELGLGQGTEEALHNLGERVPLVDLKFFITGLILQRQTGANMVDMLENLALLIRERLNLAEKLKAGTASQRMSAMLVCSIPVVMFLIYFFFKPEYITILMEHETGNLILTYAIISELIGIVIVRKMANPKF